jgi:AcrR family transcriptional regulator
MSQASKRPYRKRKRAQAEEETRRRITEAAVELHGTVGPANTKVTEVAERAGVSRMTVYNHFPTDADLFLACSTHWAIQNPLPDPSGWIETEDPAARVVSALDELYGWYARKRGMLEKVLRDAPLVPSLGELMDGYWGGYMDDVVSALSRGWSGEREDDGALQATLRVVADFHTWRTLSESGLSNASAAEVAAAMALGVARAADARRLATPRSSSWPSPGPI